MRNARGQAMTEMVFLIPLLLMLAGGILCVVFMCWQGIKVQQAANYAARIQGQERVAGGYNLASIQQDNGISGSNGDIDPTTMNAPLDAQMMQSLRARPQNRALPSGSVYRKIQDGIRGLFTTDDQQDLFVPHPKYGLVGYSDMVKVIRLWQPPEIFGMKLDPITLDATAYGGEDSHMYGLVRWGSTNGAGASNQKFWSKKEGNSPTRTNLSNPHRD